VGARRSQNQIAPQSACGSPLHALCNSLLLRTWRPETLSAASARVNRESEERTWQDEPAPPLPKLGSFQKGLRTCLYLRVPPQNGFVSYFLFAALRLARRVRPTVGRLHPFNNFCKQPSHSPCRALKLFSIGIHEMGCSVNLILL